MISLQGISKTYFTKNDQVNLFTGLDWEVKKGEFAALMWASGAGKSSILSLIAGIIKPDEGSIYLGNTDITKLSLDQMIEYRGKNIAFIFQAFELIPNLTVEENIDLVLDISRANRRYATTEILAKVWLPNKWSRYPSELSGGEQQRVAIARAFVADVPYLLADEPTGNLDETNAHKIMDLINVLHQETQNTIVMITHDSDIANNADTIYRLSGGELKKEK
jgi:putative ABC transport system ATP-binding protein